MDDKDKDKAIASLRAQLKDQKKMNNLMVLRLSELQNEVEGLLKSLRKKFVEFNEQPVDE